MNALIVVDIQNDFLPGGALAVPRSNEVLPVANRLMQQFDFVVASQDWHPLGHKSFASSHDGKKVGEEVALKGMTQRLWPDHCIQGTSGAEFSPELEVAQINHVIQKGTDPEIDSYSAFFDNGRLVETGLQTLLRSNNVGHCYVIGLATDYCVKFTVLDALDCGFQVTVVRDACRGVNLSPNDEREAFDEMNAAGAKLCLSMEIPDIR